MSPQSRCPPPPAADLGAPCEFTGAGDIGDFEDYSKLTLYGFVGCPHTKNRDVMRSSGERMVKPYFYATREYAALPPEGGKRSAVHIALQAPLRTVSGPGGRIVSAPDPHGISGCGVWKIKLDPRPETLPGHNSSALALSTTQGKASSWRRARAPP